MPKIVADTEHIIAVDKPAGLIVHSDGRTKEPSLAEWVAKNFPNLAGVGEDWISPQGESVPLNGIVHRLDRSTSGVVLIAKDQATYEYLKDEFKERRVKKVYRAFVYGHMKEDSGEIIAEIMRSSTPPKKWYARPTDRSDKRAAITKWKVLKNLKDATLLEIEPLTGRTHQIRVHLTSIGHPIISDHLYAPAMPKLLGFERPALHAQSISLTLKGGQRAIFRANDAQFQ